MKVEAINRAYLMQDIWEAYARQKLLENPGWVGRTKDKIKPYTLYNEKMEVVMDYRKFRRITEYYFDLGKKAVIKGEAFNMMMNLGKIIAVRVERYFCKRKQINWGRTKKQPLVEDPTTGKLKYARIIYFTDDDWCRIKWIKNGQLTNETVYIFEPTNRNSAGTQGFKMEFSEALRADPYLKYRFLYYPLKNKVAV